VRVYFVRHGESGSNAAKIRQGHSDPLSDVGLRQAEIVAKRFTTIPIDMIVASHYTRAQQTAEAISRSTGKPIVTSELVHETKHPTETVGLTWTDPEWIRIVDLCKSHIADPEWHYSDEENFFDLRARALKFVEYLKTLDQEQTVAVVTHGLFLIVLVLVMKFGEEFTPELYEKFRNFLYLNNTGITVLDNTYNGEWWLMTWNDYAHLGEI
jgi:broad specificity phosphatase PhoE